MSNLNKNILFVHHGKGIGGAPRSMARLAMKLQQGGHNVTVLFLYPSDAIQLCEGLNIKVVGLPILYFNHSSRWYRITEPHKILYQLISWISTAFFIAPYWLLKLQPDIVYLNSSVLTDWSFAAKILRKKNLVHVRESISKGYFGIRNKLIKSLLDFSADKIIFLSKHNINQVKTNSDKSFIIHNYVFPTEVQESNIEEKKYDFIYVGGSREIKGIELVEKILERDTKNRYCLLGYYEDRFVEKFKDRDNIFLEGVVSNPLHFITQSEALLFPATTPHFPRPVIEAYSCGTIPIATDLDGMEEIIINKKTGFTFQTNNLHGLILILDELKKVDQAKMKEEGYKLYLEKFNTQNEDLIIKELLSL